MLESALFMCESARFNDESRHCSDDGFGCSRVSGRSESKKQCSEFQGSRVSLLEPKI